MRIGIDIRALLSREPSGVGEYTQNIVTGLLSAGTGHEFHLFANAFTLDAERLRSWFPQHNVHWHLTRIPNRLLHFSLWAFQQPKLDRLINGVDVFFMPNWHFAAFSSNLPRQVLTIHDVTYRHHPEHYALRNRLWHWFIRAEHHVRAATHLIAVSEHTKRELQEVFQIPDHRITVIHSAASPLFAQSPDEATRRHVRENYQLPSQYGLVLATLEPRKNILGALTAFDRYCTQHPESDLGLIVVGSAGAQRNALQRLRSSLPSKKRIRFLGYVPSDHRPALYAESAFLLFPSFHEGFGFPVLEAAHQRTPVITSARSALPEIIGDAALLVDPHDLVQLEHAIESVMSDREFRDRLVTAAEERARTFTWERTAAETLNVLTQENHAYRD